MKMTDVVIDNWLCKEDQLLLSLYVKFKFVHYISVLSIYVYLYYINLVLAVQRMWGG